MMVNGGGKEAGCFGKIASPSGTSDTQFGGAREVNRLRIETRHSPIASQHKPTAGDANCGTEGILGLVATFSAHTELRVACLATPNQQQQQWAARWRSRNSSTGAPKKGLGGATGRSHRPHAAWLPATVQVGLRGARRGQTGGHVGSSGRRSQAFAGAALVAGGWQRQAGQGGAPIGPALVDWVLQARMQLPGTGHAASHRQPGAHTNVLPASRACVALRALQARRPQPLPVAA